MKILGFEISRVDNEPTAVVPITKNLNNYLYLDSASLKQFDLYDNVTAFVSKEFTKVKITFDEGTPNTPKLDYMLNLKPNSNQTANDLLFTFSKSMLDGGRVWYKVARNDRAVTGIEFSQTLKPGFKVFTKPYLKVKRPTKLLDQYAKLLSELSVSHSNNIIEIQSQIKTNDEDLDEKVQSRLNLLNNNIKEHGVFFTNPNEKTADHENIQTPDGTALADLKALILEHYNINQKLLTGAYTESDYRAFYATHLQPLSNAFEELLNSELLTYEAYSSGGRINVILDLMQFATLESFTAMAKDAIYNGYLQADEIRKTLGKKAYPNRYGERIYSNKNAVVLNGSEFNEPTPTDLQPDPENEENEEKTNE